MNDPDDQLQWERRVRAGDFAAIPADIGFDSALGLAIMIDGYGVAGDPIACAAIHDRVMATDPSRTKKDASALDLWIALFFKQRSDRMGGGYPLGAEEQRAYDRLAQRLRAALQRLKPKERAGILSAMDGDSYWDAQHRHRR